MSRPHRFTIPLYFSLAAFFPADGSAIDFNRDIRPILSENCYHCHGPDQKERKAKLRFDLPDSGKQAEVLSAGDPAKSEFLRRIHHADPEEGMPPPRSKLRLSKKEKELLNQWIQQGAKFDQHWSFVAPVRPEPPHLSSQTADWARNAIDHFVAKRLEQESLAPSPQAAPETLIRRVTLDLTGLPPTPTEVESFLQEVQVNGLDSAYEKTVDRLLASAAYGERMALPWLDAARYADTGGYQGDIIKSQWPWRDWGIRAYNANMPFDQFTIQQLAGDLLPEPTDNQILATAFNRNHRINDEGGIIAAEFLVEYVADRVETTGTVWMGLTIGCARCHDHKYDPVTQRDFYELFAFFHNIPENGKDGNIAPKPNLAVYTGGTKEDHAALEKTVGDLRKERSGYAELHAEALNRWLQAEKKNTASLPDFAELPRPFVHVHLNEMQKNRFENLGRMKTPALVKGRRNLVTGNAAARHGKGALLRQGGYLILGRTAGGSGFTPDQKMTWSAWVSPNGDLAGVEGPVFSNLTDDPASRGYQINLMETADGNSYQAAFRLHSNEAAGESIEVTTRDTIPQKSFSQIAVTYDGAMKASGVAIYLNGKAAQLEVEKDRFGHPFSSQEELRSGAEKSSSSAKTIRDELLGNTVLDDLRVYREALTPKQINALYHLSPVQLLVAEANPTKTETEFLSRAYFEEADPDFQGLLKKLAAAESQLKAFETNKITRVSIMEEMPKPRDTYLLDRGAYDQPIKDEKLFPNTIDALPEMPPDLPRNRLGLAKWLLRPEHPLTARVAVNRYWQMIFGAGLVKTQEDFGSQGQPPSHPELLDWLAVEFRESGWNVKDLLKLIVTSAAYQQHSAVSPALLALDPENRLLARGPRFRLYAQALRDQALALSGRLNRNIGGKPVMPYQPDGLWEELSAKGVKYKVAEGPDLYRRSLYTFWRRTVPPPSMMNFDNASREICSVKTTRTNTPLQAMNLMNDPQYVEAARLMAERMLREGGVTPEEQIAYGHRLVLARLPDSRVRRILLRGYRDYLKTYQRDPEAAKQLIAVGQSKASQSHREANLAALTAVASILLNLDETVTKE